MRSALRNNFNYYLILILLLSRRCPDEDFRMFKKKKTFEGALPDMRIQHSEGLRPADHIATFRVRAVKMAQPCGACGETAEAREELSGRVEG